MLRRTFVSVDGLLKTRETARRLHRTSSIDELQAAFRDPQSPYYIPPGTQGPDAPDSPSHSYGFNHAALSTPVNPLLEAREKLLRQRFDPQSFWEQHIVWGDLDSFQHVNNVRYARFFESARIKWLYSLGQEIGGPAKAEAMIRGRGISLILKSIEVRFRRPVTYPDTVRVEHTRFQLLIGYKPVPPSEDTVDNAVFQVNASAYSITQKEFVAHSRESIVWYDYDRLKKCDPGEEVRNLLFKRLQANQMHT